MFFFKRDTKTNFYLIKILKNIMGILYLIKAFLKFNLITIFKYLLKIKKKWRI